MGRKQRREGRKRDEVKEGNQAQEGDRRKGEKEIEKREKKRK